MGDTFQAFGVIYVGLLDLHPAGEFTTSLTSMVHSIVCTLGCKCNIILSVLNQRKCQIHEATWNYIIT